MGFAPDTARDSYRVLSVVAATAWTDGLKPRAAQVRRRRRLYRVGVLGTIVERGSKCATASRACRKSVMHQRAARRGVATPSSRRLTQRCVLSRRCRSPSNVRAALGQNAVPDRRATRRSWVPVQPQQGCWAQRCVRRSRSGRAVQQSCVRLTRDNSEHLCGCSACAIEVTCSVQGAPECLVSCSASSALRC